MIPNRVVIIFPKEDSYQYKSEETKIELKARVKKVLDKYAEIDVLRFYYFVEDWLACQLMCEEGFMPNINIFPITCFNKIDRVMFNRFCGAHDLYERLNVEEADKEVIKKYNIKYAATNDADKAVKDPVVENRNMLLKKRRSIISEVTGTQEFILVYFDKNNQFSNFVEPKLGDMRLCHRIDLAHDLQSFYFSGQDLDEELYFKVIKEGLQIG